MSEIERLRVYVLSRCNDCSKSPPVCKAHKPLYDYLVAKDEYDNTYME